MSVAAWKILVAAVLLGTGGDYLLRGGDWRAGFAVWIIIVMLCAAVVGGRPSSAHWPRERSLLMLGTVLAACGLVLRDSQALYPIDLLSVLCMGALLVWHGRGQSVNSLTVLEAVRAALLTVVNLLTGAPRVVQRTLAEHGSTPARAARFRAVAIGVFLAVPPLLLVAALLTASDVVFEGFLQDFVKIAAFDGLGHLFVAVLLAWLAMGWLRATLGDVVTTPLPEIATPGLPFLSLGVGLFAMTGLLALFLATQVRVLYGGAAFLMVTKGLTVADYARDGFFQLVVAAGVVLGTLVIAEWLLTPDDHTARRRYRVVGALLIVEVLALLVSAATRIALYVREFGLSVDRVMASAGIMFVGAVLVTFAITTLRGRTARFAPVTLMVTIGWVALLNIVNPEALVVRANLARAGAGKSFDAKYHASLSADALPALVQGASVLTAAACEDLEFHLRLLWSERLPERGTPLDWRAASLPLRNVASWYRDGAVVCPAPITGALVPLG